ncbi:lipopolysaccharide biosynthesis protein [Providencia stuartii]|uniref:lipopolysaccharide biosynthesis protein n=1 Tax=Providencia TaxID=586 RepID=UPI000D865120|nr:MULTISPECIES: lipopolysaccharide biosynthesis protein [Providencia]EMD1718120.1 lipopolysaccharide biosynthesis protein [Providencia stuartii]MBG5908332.1 lipopolysaccharide biosynthesis protein [Providencia stuartii]MTC67357.1 oligosaccharide flippase family protein [Providencia stuartii]WAZ74710.1 lipopolysaccharide biosynthesis protein [Providencia stuartii]SPY61770.1 Lipopolysaccharide biosynthesis protein wzxC [Providencia stuartii]
MDSNLKQKTTSGLKWSAIERLATQLVQLAVMLVLARMLGPHAFGLIGMLAVFIAVSQVFVDSGLSSALIRKLDRTEEDYSTAFYFNIIISLVCYVILYFSAPYIAEFYKQPELTSLTRVLSLVVIVNALAIIQRTQLSINMDFKTQAKASLAAVVLSSLIAFSMAYFGFGVWSLVGQTLSYAAFNALFLNILHRWIPRLSFNIESFHQLFGFGSKLMLSGLIDSIYQNIYQIVIGKKFNVLDVGYFTQANQLVRTPSITMTAIIQRVTYPMLSSIQNDEQRLNNAYLLTLRLSASVIFPLLFGLAVVADPLMPELLGPEWQPAALFASILAIGLLLYPIHAINLNYLQVKGRSDLFLRLEIIKKIITTIILIITIPYGIKAICIGVAVQSYLALFINTYYNGKIGQLSGYIQLKALFPIWLIALITCSAGLFITKLVVTSPWLSVMLIILIACILYVFSIRFFQKDLYQYLILNILPKKLTKKL